MGRFLFFLPQHEQTPTHKVGFVLVVLVFFFVFFYTDGFSSFWFSFFSPKIGKNQGTSTSGAPPTPARRTLGVWRCAIKKNRPDATLHDIPVINGGHRFENDRLRFSHQVLPPSLVLFEFHTPVPIWWRSASLFSFIKLMLRTLTKFRPNHQTTVDWCTEFGFQVDFDGSLISLEVYIDGLERF